MFVLASILLVVSTVMHSCVAIIIRHLKSVPVASLNSSREIVLVIISFLFILIGDIEIYAPTLTDKLKILLFSTHQTFRVHQPNFSLQCRLLCNCTSDPVNFCLET